MLFRSTAAAFSANEQAWKFNVKNSNQAEFLKYGINGKYEAHVDTSIIPHPELPCRKLTALLFLNENFEGGKFYLSCEHEKIYPPQKTGNVLIFPSFFLHGVEPVTKGTRYSVVTWLVGPWFN